MALTLVPKYARALAEQINAYYAVLRGTMPDSVDLRLNGGGRFAVHHSGTNAVVFQVTDAGATGSYQPGDIGTADLEDGAVTSQKIADNTIVNADVNAAAAIAVSKLAHVGAGNVLKSNGSTNIPGQVIDADIFPTAAIALAKLAHVGTGNVLKSNGTTNMAGQVAGIDIADGAVTSAKIADGAIADGDVNPAAGIQLVKLQHVGPGNVLKSNGSNNIPGQVIDADILPTAAIAVSKLAHIGAGNVLRSNGTTNVGGPLLAGDIPNDSITSAKIVDGSIVNGDINAAAGIVVSKLAAGGAASRVLRTNDGTTAAWGQVTSNDIANLNVGTQHIAGGGVANRVLRTNDGTNTAWGQITTADLGAVPYCFLQHNAVQTIANNTNTVLTWVTEITDNDNMHAAGAPTRMTVQTGGTWLIVANVSWSSNATGYRQIMLRYNNVAYIAENVAAGVSGANTTHTLVSIQSLSAGDFIEIYVAQGSGGNLNVNIGGQQATLFQMLRMGT